MRNRVFAVRSRILSQAALVAVLAGATAACSSDRFGKSLFTGSTNNQHEIIDGAANQAMPPAISSAPTRDVSRADLPAPVEMAGNQAPPYSGSGPYKWTTLGGKILTVQSGDSLDGLAIRYGVPSNQIAIANKISSPLQLQPGKVIVIPVKTADLDAPMPKPVAYADEPAPSRPAGKKGGATHVVESGDTLYGIARTYGVRPSEIVTANALASPSVRIGQKLKIPGGAAPAPKKVAAAEVMSTNDPHTFGGTKVLGTLSSNDKPQKALATDERPPVATIAMAKADDVKLPPAPAMPSIPVQTGEKTSAAEATAAIDQAAEPASTNGTSFRWPVRGRIISSFGSKPNGEKNDGINLAVPEGTSVKAAEAGTVIYAGNELEGYGNLVLIRHADGWVSAYAHNSAIKVKRGDQVRRGQTVATAGASGSVSSPQVHFELRKGAKPVNPLDYLAGA